MRRKPPATSRRCSIVVSNLTAMQGLDSPQLMLMARTLRDDARRLEERANPKCQRTRGIVNDMRRIAGWYRDVLECR